MYSQSRRIVCVCTYEQLRNPAYYLGLWLAAATLRVSRRKWLDELADCFCAFSGEVLLPSGEPYEIPMIDEVFGDDMDCRWMSYYLQADRSGKKPATKSRMYERLRLIDLYFRIRHPNLAEKFGA